MIDLKYVYWSDEYGFRYRSSIRNDLFKYGYYYKQLGEVYIQVGNFKLINNDIYCSILNGEAQFFEINLKNNIKIEYGEYGEESFTIDLFLTEEGSSKVFRDYMIFSKDEMELIKQYLSKENINESRLQSS